MTTDSIANAARHYSLGPDIESALKYLESLDADIQPGRYEIDEACYAVVEDYETKPLDQKRWEAHRHHTDVQLVVSGRERMGYADRSQMRSAEYDESKDLEFLDGAGGGEFATAEAGTFVIFTPDDAHMPGVSIDGPEAVRKVVVKVGLTPPKQENRPPTPRLSE